MVAHDRSVAETLTTQRYFIIVFLTHVAVRTVLISPQLTLASCALLKILGDWYFERLGLTTLFLPEDLLEAAIAVTRFS